MNESRNYGKTTRSKRRSRRRSSGSRIRLFVVLSLLVILLFGLNSITVNADTSGSNVHPETAVTKVYTSYTVQDGDNMYTIAKKYCNLNHYRDYDEYITEVENINHILASKIYAGKNITIPKYI